MFFLTISSHWGQLALVQEVKFRGCPRIREQLRCFGESDTENHGGGAESHREKERGTAALLGSLTGG